MNQKEKLQEALLKELSKKLNEGHTWGGDYTLYFNNKGDKKDIEDGYENLKTDYYDKETLECRRVDDEFIKDILHEMSPSHARTIYNYLSNKNNRDEFDDYFMSHCKSMWDEFTRSGI